MENKKLKIVVATRNRGKLLELQRLLASCEGAEVELLTLDDIGFTEEIVEDGESFAENAMIKAKTVADHCRMIAIGDDSGLCVDALGGAPGVHSARYAVEHDDAANNAKLLRELEGCGDGERGAAFVCSMACVFPQGCGIEGEPIEVSGRCEGEITKAPQGNGGFGYDPLFYCPEFGTTFASLTPEQKNSISHRGRASAGLCAALAERLADR